MIEASWLLFIVASLVLIATPGQDMILVMSHSVAQGSRAGVATAAGVSVGLVGDTVLATLGLGAILRTSEWLFLALKLAGAAYLIYLGIGLLRTRSSELTVGARHIARCASCFAIARYPIYPTPRSPSSISHSCPIRRTHGASPNRHGVRAGTRVCGVDVRRQGARGPLRRRAVRLASFAPRRAHVDLPFSGAVLLGLGARLALERR